MGDWTKPESETTTITTATAHGFRAGDEIAVHRSRWQDLRRLLTKPRAQYIVETTANSMTLHDRRMTWHEWFRALWKWITR